MKSNIQLGEAYQEHRLFEQVNKYAEFYDALSYSVMNFVSQGTKAMINIDTYVYSSIERTLESIRDVLQKGRINDSYALLRKYYDSTIINVYSSLYLKDHFSIENFVVKQIDNWVKGVETLPEYRVMSKYIRDSIKLKPITILLQKDRRYRDIRDRYNDHTHYNFYRNLVLNDNELYIPDRLRRLDTFSADLTDIFAQHFSCIFYLNDYYMMSSDYIDSLEAGMTPIEDSQYFVAPFIQNIFDTVIKIHRPDLAEQIMKSTSMQLK